MWNAASTSAPSFQTDHFILHLQTCDSVWFIFLDIFICFRRLTSLSSFSNIMLMSGMCEQFSKTHLGDYLMLYFCHKSWLQHSKFPVFAAYCETESWQVNSPTATGTEYCGCWFRHVGSDLMMEIGRGQGTD